MEIISNKETVINTINASLKTITIENTALDYIWTNARTESFMATLINHFLNQLAIYHYNNDNKTPNPMAIDKFLMFYCGSIAFTAFDEKRTKKTVIDGQNRLLTVYFTLMKLSNIARTLAPELGVSIEDIVLKRLIDSPQSESDVKFAITNSLYDKLFYYIMTDTIDSIKNPSSTELKLLSNYKTISNMLDNYVAGSYEVFRPFLLFLAQRVTFITIDFDYNSVNPIQLSSAISQSIQTKPLFLQLKMKMLDMLPVEDFESYAKILSNHFDQIADISERYDSMLATKFKRKIQPENVVDKFMKLMLTSLYAKSRYEITNYINTDYVQFLFSSEFDDRVDLYNVDELKWFINVEMEHTIALFSDYVYQLQKGLIDGQNSSLIALTSINVPYLLETFLSINRKESLRQLNESGSEVRDSFLSAEAICFELERVIGILALQRAFDVEWLEIAMLEFAIESRNYNDISLLRADCDIKIRAKVSTQYALKKEDIVDLVDYKYSKSLKTGDLPKRIVRMLFGRIEQFLATLLSNEENIKPQFTVYQAVCVVGSDSGLFFNYTLPAMPDEALLDLLDIALQDYHPMRTLIGGLLLIRGLENCIPDKVTNAYNRSIYHYKNKVASLYALLYCGVLNSSDFLSAEGLKELEEMSVNVLVKKDEPITLEALFNRQELFFILINRVYNR